MVFILLLFIFWGGGSDVGLLGLSKPCGGVGLEFRGWCLGLRI